MKVKEIMIKNVLETKADYSIKEVSRHLIKNHINCMPVVDNDGSLIGIVTQADIFRAILPSYDELYKEGEYINFEQIEARSSDVKNRNISNIMTKEVIYVDEETPVVKAGSIMLLKKIKQIPVINSNKKLVGLITFHDIIEELIINR
ncbi:MAG: CBS domain-containing protein [Spirochaetota bacterium]|nr:CBS domain-containing protein [Spirochaetota bacterium]